MHTYEYTKGVWKLHIVKSVSEAKKSPKDLAVSVTTKIAKAPMSERLEDILLQRILDLHDQHPKLSLSELKELSYGERQCPDTGKLIPSSDFGTALHDRLEQACLLIRDGVGQNVKGSGYYPWVEPWLQWLEKNKITIVDCELTMGCRKRKLAGMLDFIGKKDGRVFLADYKSREARDLAQLKSKAYYDKDDMQLAIEARMVQEQFELDYLPRIYTVLFNTNEPMMHVKLWTERAQAKAEKRFGSLNTFYNQWVLDIYE